MIDENGPELPDGIGGSEKCPLVSVLLVTYNFERYVGEALNAILRQDYCKFEIIVCDDCSTDATRVIVSDYQKRFPGIIRLSFTEKNLGTSANLNRGLQLAKGKYWALTSGDDVFLPGKLSAQVEYLENHNDCVICYHDQIVFDSVNPSIHRLNSEIEFPREGGVDEVVRYGTFCGGSSMLVRVNEPKVFVRERIRYASDWLFVFDCVKSGGRISYLDKPLAKYRRHQRNVTNLKSVRNNIDMVKSALIMVSERPSLILAAVARIVNGAIGVFSRMLKRKSFYRLDD